MNTLIIKFGAKGDVLRTTSLLRVLEGDVYWITRENAFPLLENNPFLTKFTSDVNDLKDVEFDLVLSMDDDLEGCKVLNEIKYKKMEGFYAKDGKIKATALAKEWFDMGLHGGENNDVLKKENQKPMQSFFFNLLGKEFNGEEYVLNVEGVKEEPNLVGIEVNVGPVWPMKRWNKYDELKNALEEKGYKVRIFPIEEGLRDYIKDIARCSMVICGDSLPMHIALALKKKTIALFGPTSAAEIYDYGRLKKVLPRMDCVCCYKRSCDVKPSCMDQIKVQDVLEVIE